MEPVDPDRLDLAREFYARPNGPHGVELQKLLMKLRWDSPTEQFIAVQTEIGGAWYLARITGPRPLPLEVYIDCPLSTAAEASWAVFRKRWEGFTGQVLTIFCLVFVISFFCTSFVNIGFPLYNIKKILSIFAGSFQK